MDDGRLRELNNCDDDDVLLVLFCRRAARIERGSGENMVVLLNFTARYDVRSSRRIQHTHMDHDTTRTKQNSKIILR